MTVACDSGICGGMLQLLITMLCVMHYIQFTCSQDCCTFWQTLSAPNLCTTALYCEGHKLSESDSSWLQSKVNNVVMPAAQHSYVAPGRGGGGGSKEGLGGGGGGVGGRASQGMKDFGT